LDRRDVLHNKLYKCDEGDDSLKAMRSWLTYQIEQLRQEGYKEEKHVAEIRKVHATQRVEITKTKGGRFSWLGH